MFYKIDLFSAYPSPYAGVLLYHFYGTNGETEALRDRRTRSHHKAALWSPKSREPCKAGLTPYSARRYGAGHTKAPSAEQVTAIAAVHVLQFPGRCGVVGHSLYCAGEGLMNKPWLRANSL